MPPLPPDRRAELERAARSAINEIADPCSVANGTSIGLTDMGLVKAVTVSPEGDVRVDLRLTTPTCNMLGFMAEECSARVRDLRGVRRVEIIADEGLDWSPSMIAPAAQAARRERLKVLHARLDDRRRVRGRRVGPTPATGA